MKTVCYIAQIYIHNIFAFDNYVFNICNPILIGLLVIILIFFIFILLFNESLPSGVRKSQAPHPIVKLCS